MTQARFIAPQLVDHAMLAQRGEQRQQRQAENGEIVAVDLVEELDAEPFDLVGADGGQRRLAHGGEIAADELRRAACACQASRSRYGAQSVSPLRASAAAVCSCMGLAGQREQLAPRRLHVAGL